MRSLEKLEKNLRARKGTIKVITGHTGWTDDLDFVFRHRTEICKPFTKKYSDPEAKAFQEEKDRKRENM